MCHIYLYIIKLYNRIKDKIYKYNRLNKIQIQIDSLIKNSLSFCPVKENVQ